MILAHPSPTPASVFPQRNLSSDKVLLPMIRSIKHYQFVSAVLCLSLLGIAVSSATAADPPSPAAPLMRLIKSGRVPQERLGNLIELVCQRGNAADLSYLFEQAVLSDKYPRDLRIKTLSLLTATAHNRKIQPAGDLAGLTNLIAPETPNPTDAGLQLAAIRLAGACRAKSLAQPLAKIVLDSKSPLKTREAAINALVDVDPESAKQTIDPLISPQQPLPIRSLGVAALVGLDAEAAASAAAEVLASADETQDPATLLDAFLSHKGGPDQLAAAIAGKTLAADVAKVALRHMYSVGRTDAALVSALSSSAGLSANPEPLSPEQVKTLAAEVLAEGDAQRGEAVFRRADVSCMKCHSVSKAGGQVGPDLSAVGSSSPVEYLINSIMQPNQAIKEAYLTRVVVTDAGKVHQGIVVDRNDQRLILKDATSQEIEIPISDIDEEFEGESLMPQGLTKFLTHAEIVDLVRFLAELGKAGPLAVRKTPTIQRWRVLRQLPESIAAETADADLLREETLALGDEAWVSVYAKVAGGLPISDARKAAPAPLVYLRAEVDVTIGGEVGFEINSPLPIQAAVDDQPLKADGRFVVELAPGRHVLNLFVDTSTSSDGDVQAELFRVKGSPAEFEVVGGQ